MIEEVAPKDVEVVEPEVTLEASSEQSSAPKEPEMTKEEALENVVKQLEEQGLKLMPVDEITSTQTADSKSVIKELESLKNEVVKKKVLAQEKSSLIKGKVNDLLESGKVNVDQDEYKKSEVSVEKYTQLLTNIVAEVDHEIAYFAQMIGDKIPQNIVVPQSVNDDFKGYFKKKVKYARKYAKNMRKDLNVSYSRYCFGFDAQLRRISFIESYLRTVKSEQKHVS